MYYKIGLDIGISSVGWATLELNTLDEPIRIIDLGVRIFDAAEHPKDGASLALPRREARSARRRLRRHRHRLARIKYLLEQSGGLSQEEMTRLFAQPQSLEDIYTIRVHGLDQVLDREQWTRLLIHLAQRRGFKSSRKIDTADQGDTGLLTEAVAANKALFAEKHYRTIGEMLYYDETFRQTKRNKKGSYLNTMDRDMLVEEIQVLFAQQRQLGNPLATEAMEEAYLAIYTSQRPFDVGPGGKSPYGGDQIAKMVGTCTFEPTEKRAAKATYTFESFTVLQKINHLRVGHQQDRPLDGEERALVLALAKSRSTLNYSDVRKKLALPADQYFSDLSYGNKSAEEVEKKAKFPTFSTYCAIQKALKKKGVNDIAVYSIAQLDSIGYALTVYKNDAQIRSYFAEHDIPQADWEALLELPCFSKFGNLSIKACQKMMPYLAEGMTYSDACQEAGYDFRGHHHREKSTYLPKTDPVFDDITNPVVRRAVSQTIKVINQIIKGYDTAPAYVSLELAREMSKDFSERKLLEKKMQDNNSQNARLKARITENYGKINPTGLDIVKLKLYEEQDGICPYSLKPLEINRIFETGYAEVDHIIPYSISFNDGYVNKVLVHTQENQHKGNRLPMVYLQDMGRQDAYVVWVKKHYAKNWRKQSFLLKEALTPEEESAFKERNLQDTQYISRLMRNFIADNLLPTPNYTGHKKTVTAVNGAVTGYLRKRWGITKIREDGDLHHAVDAVVIACITDGMIQKVSQYSRDQSNRYVTQGENIIHRATGEVIHRFPVPWPHFRDELDIRLSNNPQALLPSLPLMTYPTFSEIQPVFVSRMPNHKVRGAAHKETIRSLRVSDEGEAITVSKRPLSELKVDNDGEIKDYYNPSSDRLLYEALRAQLLQYDGHGEKAFLEPFYKPTASGAPGPLVRSVKCYAKASLPVPVHQGRGVADNDSMVRIDVFLVPDEGYYFVPIYIADTLKETLPNLAVIPYKPWREMREENFIFSLYHNDLIHVVTKEPKTWSLCHKDSRLPPTIKTADFLAYYLGANISSASIGIITHDHTYTIKSMGIKTLVLLEKFQVDVLGQKHKVQRESRQDFTQMRRDSQGSVHKIQEDE